MRNMRDVDMKAQCTSSLFQILKGVSSTQLPWTTNNGPMKIEKNKLGSQAQPHGQGMVNF